MEYCNIPSKGVGVGGGEGVEKLLVISCYRSQDKLVPDEPLDSCTDFLLYLHLNRKHLTFFGI